MTTTQPDRYAEWVHLVGETDENRTFDQWMADTHTEKDQRDHQLRTYPALLATLKAVQVWFEDHEGQLQGADSWSDGEQDLIETMHNVITQAEGRP